MHFEFCKSSTHDSIFLVNEWNIFIYDIINDELEYKRTFQYELCKKPEIFVFNDDQSIVFIAAKEDVLFIDFNQEDKEIDIDSTFNISDIRACHYHQGKFFVLANKYE